MRTLLTIAYRISRCLSRSSRHAGTTWPAAVRAGPHHNSHTWSSRFVQPKRGGVVDSALVCAGYLPIQRQSAHPGSTQKFVCVPQAHWLIALNAWSPTRSRQWRRVRRGQSRNLPDTAPSDHIASARIIAMALSEINIAYGVLGRSYVVITSFAVIYLGEHYLIDVFVPGEVGRPARQR
jgi:hypothetical protein